MIDTLDLEIRNALRRGPASVIQLCRRLGVNRGTIRGRLRSMKARGEVVAEPRVNRESVVWRIC